MSSLNDQLFELYADAVYPVLIESDPVYRRSLAKAGLRDKQKSIPQEKQSSFRNEMRLQSWLAANKIQSANSLAPGSIRAKLISGPLTLYRVSQRGAAAPGIWWFTEKVARRCRDEAGSESQKQLNWLRNVLAVCFNWSRFDQIERISLWAGESMPAVIGRGLPMPQYKFEPYIDRKTGARVIDELPPDYWKQKGTMLLGGEL
jgi:hypothetical protein